MNLVRENINFERGLDPKSALGIGSRRAIVDWFDSFPFYVSRQNYKINEDLSVDINHDFPLSLQGDKELFPNGELPPYINFRTTGDLDVDDCRLKSLRGFPKQTDGYFSCQMNQLTSLKDGPKEVFGSYYCNGNPGKFSEKDVRNICYVSENVQADDTPDP